MIGASIMDLQTMSRKELQALCKSNGIPANKSNIYMMEALAEKRIPLSQVDANQRVGRSIANPAKKSNLDAKGIDPARKPPLFTNNFLKRGKRKDPPTSHESDNEGPRKPSIDLCQQHSPGAHVRNISKGQIEDRIRSQINAALCSKVMKPPERRPSALTSIVSSESVLESNVKVDSSEGLDFPLGNPDQHKEGFPVKVESTDLPPGREDLRIEQFSSTDPLAVESTDLPPGREDLRIEQFSSTDPLALQITKGEENVSTASCGIASPQLRVSPLVRHVEERVGSIIDRIQDFWKRRDLQALSSPLQSTGNVTECFIFSTPPIVPQIDR